jgi:undecaprenyl diphosphate synthase
MELLVNTLKKEISMLQEKNVKLRVIGEISSLPENCQKNLLDAISETSGNTGLNLIIALSYSGRWEITRAMQEIAREVAEGRIKPENIDEKLIADHLNTAKIPDPELLIRSGGEMRVSNFLLWQIAYTELFVTQKLWPDFRKEDLYEAICAYQRRERRFGKVVETPRLTAS